MAALAVVISAAAAHGFTIEMLTAAAVNTAGLDDAETRAKSAIVKAQVLLDRARFSPGVIDGEDGDNLRRALMAFQRERGLEASGRLTPSTWAMLMEISGGPVVRDYRITHSDLKGPFVGEIPGRLEDQARLKHLGFVTVEEALAEKFHVSEALLSALNPGKAFDVGTVIEVPALEPVKLSIADRIEVLKGDKLVRVLDAEGRLMAAFPASIGSDEKPAPSGTLTVRKVARGPSFTYKPKYAFAGVVADKPFRIAAGPNNPVGTVWIDFGRDGLGMHGTPEPHNIGKTFSHGCVRLTNWDVERLASAVKKGTIVEFKD